MTRNEFIEKYTDKSFGELLSFAQENGLDCVSYIDCEEYFDEEMWDKIEDFRSQNTIWDLQDWLNNNLPERGYDYYDSDLLDGYYEDDAQDLFDKILEEMDGWFDEDATEETENQDTIEILDFNELIFDQAGVVNE